MMQDETLKTSRVSTGIFVLLLVVPAICTLLFGAVDQITWSLVYLAWAGVGVLWAANSWSNGGWALERSPLLIPVAALVCIGIVQLLPLPYVGSIDPTSTWFFELRLIVVLTFFAGYLTFIDSERRLRRAVNFIIIFGAGMAFYGILQRLGSPQGIYGLRESSQAVPFGPFVNQHHFAAFMEMTGGLTLGILFGEKTSRDHRILLAVAVIVMGSAVAFTGSRGGALSFAFVVAFVVVFRLFSREGSPETNGLSRHMGVVVAGVALLAVVFTLVLFLGGNDQLLRGTGVTTAGADIATGRFHFWPIALKIFLEHPLFGSGFDSFAFAFTKFDSWPGLLRVEQAHNDYLQTLSDSGIAGALCVAAFILLLFRGGLRTVRKSHEYRRYAAVGALAGCFGILIHSFFDFPLRTYSNAFFFLLLAAIATVPIIDEHRRRRKHHRSDQ